MQFFKFKLVMTSRVFCTPYLLKKILIEREIVVQVWTNISSDWNPALGVEAVVICDILMKTGSHKPGIFDENRLLRFPNNITCLHASYLFLCKHVSKLSLSSVMTHDIQIIKFISKVNNLRFIAKIRKIND